MSLRGNPFYKLVKLGFMFYLKTISNIKRSNPENKYMLKVNTRNTRRKCDMFKVNNNDSRTMTPFCSSVIECHNTGFKKHLPVQSQQYRH